MRLLMFAYLAVTALLTSGCGGSTIITRTSANVPEQIRSATFSAQSGNSSEVTGYVSEALASQGVATQSVTPSQGLKSNDVDAIVTYVDVWRWDLVTYMQSIAISLYNAKTGELLVTGRWKDSLFHTYFRGDSISRDLVNQMFEKLQLKQIGEGRTLTSAMQESVPKAPEVSSQVAVRLKKVNEYQVSKNEYTAREQARTLQCNAQGILGTEGVGTPREEIVFDCGAGRKVTIVCRSGLGCS